jgi:hypothetical protein
MVISVSVPLDGRVTSISPLITTKKGKDLAANSINISPPAVERLRPCVAIRAICWAVSVGNNRAARDGTVGSSGRMTPIIPPRADARAAARSGAAVR